MKLLLPFLFAYFFFIPFSIIGQNLVPDSGFEIVHRMPSKENNSATCTKYWMSPTSDGVSDYYHKGAGRHSGTPKNIFGRQKPHSGDAYGGICIRKKFIEYLETKLIDTLIKDQEYLVEFYISRAERSIGIVKEFGALFTKKNRIGLTGIGIPIEPSVDFVKPKGYKNKRKWIKFSAVYRAEGNETALTLGYFNYNKSKRFKGYSHYYVDDVSVTPIKMQNDSVIYEKSSDSSEVSNTEINNSIPQTFAPKAGQAITLKKVFFATNKSELLPGSFTELDKLVQYLSKDFRAYIRISGHTDNTGNEEQNKTLSELRAKAVADYLKLKGVDSFRINYEGYGSLKPIASNSTDEGKQLNRRVEFTIDK